MKQGLQVAQEPRTQAQAGWLNRNVIGMGVASLLSDAGHEMATAVLPGFLAVLGVSAAMLGTIEGDSGFGFELRQARVWVVFRSVGTSEIDRSQRVTSRRRGRRPRRKSATITGRERQLHALAQ